MIPVFINGECVYKDRPTVMEIQQVFKNELETLWDESKRLVNPHEIHIDLSQKLWDLKKKLLDEHHHM